MKKIMKKLYPFQRDGVKYIQKKKGRVLLADDQGLGKSVTVAAWLALNPDKRPVVIVCPAGLKLHWKKEIRKWVKGESVVVLDHKTPNPIMLERKSVIIVNYDILGSFTKQRNYNKNSRKWSRGHKLNHNCWATFILAKSPMVLVLDEVHRIKNSAAQQTKAVQYLSKVGRIPHVIAISGTPVINAPVEIYNALELINPHVIPSFYSFTRRYCKPKLTRWGWTYTGAENTEELNRALTRLFMLRRTKEDVKHDLPDLPDKNPPKVILLGLTNRKEYQEAENDFLEYVKRSRGQRAYKKAQRAEFLTKMAYLRRLTATGKIKKGVKWIKRFFKNNPGEKLVLFAIHRNVVRDVAREFPGEVVTITGSTPSNERERAVHLFQNNKRIRLLIGNIRAAGVGLTLTAASNLAFLEFAITPAEINQASDRIHRIGQDKTVTIHFLAAKGTIEQKLVERLANKDSIIASVIDGQPRKPRTLFTDLLKSLEVKAK